KEGNVSFPNGKKPIDLIKTCLELSQDQEDIVLDFFAGSSSTAHAVVDKNKEDGGSRKYVMVQLPEKIDKSKKENRGLIKFCENNNIEPNIAEVGKQRIRNVIEKSEKKFEGISQKQLKLEEEYETESELDLGFKVFKL